LLNLISNAVKFTNLGGSIDISTGDLGYGFIEVVLCDTGTGIPNELMDYMFKPFVQATNAL
jgi:signal transduction histidine kinase